jgi:hypothetical protein
VLSLIRVSDPPAPSENLLLAAVRVLRSPHVIMPHPYKDLKEWSERCAALGLAEAPAVELPVQSGKGVEVRMRRNGPTGPLRGVPFDKAPGATTRGEWIEQHGNLETTRVRFCP